MMQSLYLQRIMKKNADMGQKKQTQTNPIFVPLAGGNRGADIRDFSYSKR